MATVTLTLPQLSWLQSLVSTNVQGKVTSDPAYSGEISNADTFQENDLVVAKAVLAAIQAHS